VTLSVDIFTRDDGGEMSILDVPHSQTLAGFESWRTSVWGSERVRSLGARFFPRLAAEDLYVDPEQIEQLQAECALLRANLETVAAGVDPRNPRGVRGVRGVAVDGRIERREAEDPHQAFMETVSARLANIEAAARRAREIGAGVVIW
jgi:hypothetical protein